MYQANNRSNILDYSSNKEKSRNTGTTRHQSVSPNIVGGENESSRSAHSKSMVQDSKEKDSMLQDSSGNSGNSNAARVSNNKPVRPNSECTTKPNIDRQNRDKDSLLMDSVLYNQHSTSYKEMRHNDSIQENIINSELTKVNMTEDIGKDSFIFGDKKKAKDKKFLNKLVDRSGSGHKKQRPKSSKGIRSNHVKVNTMSNVDPKKELKSRNISNYLNSKSTQGNRLRSKQSGSKKTRMLGVRPNSGKDFRNLKSLHR